MVADKRTSRVKEVVTNRVSPVMSRPKKNTTTTIRISEMTKRRIDVLVKKVNTKSFGKHVKPDAMHSACNHEF
jgi:hypothetical protein